MAAGDGVRIDGCSIGVDVGIDVSDGRSVGKVVLTGDGRIVSVVRVAASELVADGWMVGRLWLAAISASGVFSLAVPELAITAPAAANNTRISKAEPASKTILFDF